MTLTFQSRFKSVLVEDEDYLKELIRYIHLNPVRAAIVTDPQKYIWSSHRAYMGLGEFVWLSKDRVLMKFHHQKEHAINNFEKFILMGVGIETSFDFIDEVSRRVNKKPSKKIELSDLIAKVCELHKMTVEELCAPGKSPRESQARALLAFLVRETNYLSLQSLGKFLGRDPSGLTKQANRFEIKTTQNQAISEKLKEMRSWLSRED